MKRRTRVYYTDKQKSFMWERWKQGDSMSNIAAPLNGMLTDRRKHYLNATSLIRH